MDLEATLIAMYAFGEPRIYSSKSGWSCSVDMHVNATCAKFEIRSEFGHTNPTAAATECLNRMHDILKGLRTNVARLDMEGRH